MSGVNKFRNNKQLDFIVPYLFLYQTNNTFDFIYLAYYFLKIWYNTAIQLFQTEQNKRQAQHRAAMETTARIIWNSFLLFPLQL